MPAAVPSTTLSSSTSQHAMQIQSWCDNTSRLSQGKPQKERKCLGSSYEPQPFDVIIAKGSTAKRHTGNMRLQVLIDMNVENYRLAGRSTTRKSSLVSEIVEAIQVSSPEGGFIQNIKGQWYKASDQYAREKVGQGFRDILHNSYRSSSKAKVQRRKNVKKRPESCKSSPVESNEATPLRSSSAGAIRPATTLLEARSPAPVTMMQRQESMIVSDIEDSDEDRSVLEQSEEEMDSSSHNSDKDSVICELLAQETILVASVSEEDRTTLEQPICDITFSAQAFW